MTSDPGCENHDEADASRQDRIEEVIASYLLARERGERPGRSEILARNPDIAENLKEFFADEESLSSFVREAEPEEDPPPAAIGDYHQLLKIGEGAMGVVYRATQRSLNRVVALKVIRAGALASRSEKARFRIEAESAAALDHPHIVPIYEIGEWEGKPYYSMRHIEGGNLAQCFARSLPGPRPLAGLLLTVASAVHYAHQRGIIHRDLKPANILLNSESEPLVGDFGLAKRLGIEDGLTLTGGRVGTLDYMSPEQADGKKELTTAVDVFGLGAILYEGLVGVPPFRSELERETLRRIAEEDPVPPARRSRKVPSDLSTICLKCLEKVPEARYGSAGDLAEDLRRFLASEPILARPSGILGRGIKWVRRRPARAALLSIALAAVFSAGALEVREIGMVHQHSRELEESNLRETRLKLEALKDARLLRKAKYAVEIEQAARAIEGGEPILAERFLNAWNSDSDGLRWFEWRHLLRRCHPYSWCTLWTGGLDRLLYSPDASKLVGVANGFIEIDSRPDPPRALFGIRPEAIAFTSDGKRLVGFHRSGRLLVLDASGGTVLEDIHIPLGDQPSLLSISPQGSFLAWLGRDGDLNVRKALGNETGRVFSAGSPFLKLMFSPQEDRLAAGCADGTIRMFDLASGTDTSQRQMTASIDAIAFAPDGTRIAWSGADGKLGLAEIGPSAPGGSMVSVDSRIPLMAFSPDGRLLACGREDNRVAIHDARDLKSIYTISWHRAPLCSVTFRPSGGILTTAEKGGAAYDWDLARLDDIPSLEEPISLGGPDVHTAPVLSVYFSKDGKDFFSGDESGAVVRWSLIEKNGIMTARKRATLRVEVAPSSPFSLSPDGRWAASTGRGGRLYVSRLAWEAEPPAVESHALVSPKEPPTTALAFSRDSKKIAAARASGLVEVRVRNENEEWSTTPCSSIRPSIDGPWSLWFSPDGCSLSVASPRSSLIELMDIASARRKAVLSIHSDCVKTMAISSDSSRMVSGGPGQQIQAWDLTAPMKGDMLEVNKGSIFFGHGGGVSALFFSADGRFVVSGGGEGEVKIWELFHESEGDSTLKAIGRIPLRGMAGPVRAIALSPDEAILIAAGGKPGVPGELFAWRAFSP